MTTWLHGNRKGFKGSRLPERRGAGKVAIDRHWSRAATIEVCLLLNFDVVFDFKYFCFRPSKAKFIGNFLTNRQNTAHRFNFFPLFNNVHCLLTHRITLRYEAMRSKQKKKIREIKFLKLMTPQI